jgi:hypothetical protein
MRKLPYLVAALAFAGAVITGCSSSSTTTNTEPDSGPVHDSGTADAKSDSKTNPVDSGKDTGNVTGEDGGDSSVPPTPEAGTDSGKDTGTTIPDSGACNYATFVIGLITNDTTATALPSTDLGAACTDDQKQSDFASLF